MTRKITDEFSALTPTQAYHARRKAKGLCAEHGCQNPADDKRTQCTEHRKINSLRVLKRYYLIKQAKEVPNG